MTIDVIASVLPASPAAAIGGARAAAMAGADWLELRLDVWPADAPLDAVIGAAHLPVLVACRMPRDGGRFAGSTADRRALLERALAAGARGIDLEHWESWTPAQRPPLVVRSQHVLEGVPGELPRLRDALLAGGADRAKLVVTPADLADTAPLLDLLASCDQRRQPTVAFAQGEAAWPTRVLACLLGAPAIYGSVDGGTATAPGQLPIEQLLGLLRLRTWSRGTALLGLLGLPARHSFGTWLHNRALRRLGFDGVYLPFETARPAEVVAMLSPWRLQGLSVTAPHKRVVADLCHRLDDSARRCGAVNTLTFPAGGQVIGSNTDVDGVVHALGVAGFGVGGGRTAVVLGGGGAARAAAVALQQLGYSVAMACRRPDSVEEFATDHGVTALPWAAGALAECQPAVVVHATPVGGHTRPDEGERVLPEWRPAAGAAVLDMVYRPAATRLLGDAATAGAVAIAGTEMFVGQAAAQLRQFTGRTLPASELNLLMPRS